LGQVDVMSQVWLFAFAYRACLVPPLYGSLTPSM
jgi:hypothetical protein